MEKVKWKSGLAVALSAALLINQTSFASAHFEFLDEDEEICFTGGRSEKRSHKNRKNLTASPSEAKEASPAEAERKATSSDAEKVSISEIEKASPAEAKERFKYLLPEENEIPAYYKQVGYEDKTYWNFLDRTGMFRYRVYGEIHGKTGWVICDEKGEICLPVSFISPKDEDLTLAAYRYQSANPEKSDWETLSQQLYGDSRQIFKMEREEVFDLGMNGDGSLYGVWIISRDLSNRDESVMYYMYGHIVNTVDKKLLEDSWHECDEQGTVLKTRFVHENKGIPLKETWKVEGDELIVTITGNYNLQYWKDPEDKRIGDAVDAYIWPVLNFNGAVGYFNYSDSSERDSKKLRSTHCYTENYGTYWINSDGEKDHPKNDWDNYREVKFDVLDLESCSFISYGSGSDMRTLTCGETEAVNIAYDKSKMIYKDRASYEVYEPDSNGTRWKEYSMSSKVEGSPLVKRSDLKTIKAFDSMIITSDFGTKRRGQPCTTTFRIKNPNPELSSITLMMREYGQYVSEKDSLGVDHNEYWVNPVQGGGFLNAAPLCDFQSGAAQAHRHSSEEIEIISATCTKPGKKNGKCTKCEQEIDEVIPALGHESPSNYVTTANDGTHYKNCSRCNVRLETKYNPYRIRFHANGGTGSMPDEVMTYHTPGNLTGNQFSRQAYLFDGWTTSQDGSGVLYQDKQSVNDLTKIYNGTVDLYAKWKLNECTVTYDAQGGSVPIKNKKVICKTNIGSDTLPKAERFGYTFLGWSLKKDGPDTLLTPNSQMETIEVTAYAQWRPNGYDLTLDPAGGTVSESKTTAYFDAPVGELPEPTKNGETFTGWQTVTKSRAAGIPITPSTVLKTAGMNLIATYSTEAYTIHFDGNGGSTNASDLKRSYGQAYGTLPDASRSGYSFKGWFTEKSGGTMVTETSTAPAYNQILYAHWSPLRYQVKFDANGGTGTMASQYIDYGSSVELEKNKFLKEYHQFVGWNTAADGNGTSYEDGMPVKNLTDRDVPVILYAQWKRTGAVCTFYDWNGTLLGNSTCDIGGAVNFRTPEREGYTFTGWQGIDGASINNIKEPGSYQATYKINSYKAEFFNGKEKISEIEKNYQEMLGSLPETEKEGCIFTGWNLKEDGIGENVTESTVMPTSGLKCYAQFSPKSYTVTFHYEGGTKEEEKRTVTYQESLGTLPESKKTGFVFAGWNTAPDESGTAVTKDSKMGASDLELYAVWKPEYFTCRFLNEDGVEMERLQVRYDQTATPKVPVKTGYVFLDWDKSLDHILADTAFAASFRPSEYTISFAVNETMYPGTSGQMETVSATYDRITHLHRTAFEKEHFTFTGWSMNEDGTGKLILDAANVINLTAEDMGNVTLYAQFKRTESPCEYRDFDETVLKEEVIPCNGTGIAPEVPKRIGYGFTGWDKELTNITEPTVFTACYMPNRYKICFDANGGSGLMPSQTMTYDTASRLEKAVFEKERYTFFSWNTRKDGTGNSYLDEESVKNLTADGEVALYAVWDLTRKENADGSYTVPGKDGIFGTEDDETYTVGSDGIAGTADDKKVIIMADGTAIIDNENGTYTTAGKDGIFGTKDDETYTLGADKIPGTADDRKVEVSVDGIFYIDNQDGTNTRPGKDGIFGTKDDEIYSNGADGKPGTADDEKYFVKKSSGSGGHGGGGSSSVSVLSGTGPEAGAITGIWIQNEDASWNFKKADGELVKESWAYIANPYAAQGQSQADWFRFDDTGKMMTGWFSDAKDGHKYYLSEKSDGTKGHMYTGWNWIPNEKGILECYYFNPLSDGTKGALYKNGKTPDGYDVNEHGQWIVGAQVQTKEN